VQRLEILARLFRRLPRMVNLGRVKRGRSQCNDAKRSPTVAPVDRR
jgi:hypothetical protein